MFALPRPRLVQLSGETSSRIITMRAEALGRRHTALLGKPGKACAGGGRSTDILGTLDVRGRCMYCDWAILDEITGRARRVMERRENSLRGIESGREQEVLLDRRWGLLCPRRGEVATGERNGTTQRK